MYFQLVIVSLTLLFGLGCVIMFYLLFLNLYCIKLSITIWHTLHDIYAKKTNTRHIMEIFSSNVFI